MLQLEFLDHVAIKVKNLEASAKWYESVLGLKRFHPKEWQPFPIMLLAGNSGIALFPIMPDTQKLPKGNWQTMAHFAFRVNYRDLEKAKLVFTNNKISFEFQDHHYFHSIYLSDPDGYQVELTAEVIEAI